MEQIQTPALQSVPEWRVSGTPVAYAEAVSAMEQRVSEIAQNQAGELVWLLEHPPLYTAGTSAKPEDLLDPDFLPVHRSGRGGQFTYHGPGQRVAYVMLDLRRHGLTVRAYSRALEEWAIRTLAAFGVTGERREGRVGIWVADPSDPAREAKIAAVGVRVRRGVTYHGLSLNLDPDLSHYKGINPCGLPLWPELGVTSLAALGIAAGMRELDAALMETFEGVFPA